MNRDVLKQDVDYLFHVEHEVPMDLFIRMEEVKEGLVDLMLTHTDATAKRELSIDRLRIADALKEHIGPIVLKKDIHDW